jgi:hypothetical protein
MQLVDRIEKRRFVGREFLLWLWFESELFDATLSSGDSGPFGLWLEKRLVLSAGKDSTRITASSPGRGREAKEALLAGQLPESAGIRITSSEEETSFVLRAEALGVSGLKLPGAVLGKEGDAPNVLLEEMMGKRGKKPRKKERREDEAYEAFYERMRLTHDFEALLESLYRDFLRFRLSPRWKAVFVPAARAWARGEEVDAERYRAERDGEPRRGRRSAAG